MTGEPKRYLAYMLRLWRAGSSDGPVWRASLENPQTGERLVFGDLDALLAFLHHLIGDSVVAQGGKKIIVP